MAEEVFMNEILPFLNCALSTSKNEHLCQEPVLLSCGHHICKACLLPEINHSTIKCANCNELNKRDLNQEQSVKMFQVIFKANINKLFELVSEKFKNTLKTCKNTINDVDNTAEQHFQFIKDEMQIRVESFKIDLDNLYESFKLELDEILDEWRLNSKNTLSSFKFDEKQIDDMLNKLEENTKKQENINNESIYYYQNQTKLVQDLINEYNTKVPRLKFKENTPLVIENELMDQLLFEKGDDCSIMHHLKKSKYKKFVILHGVMDVTVLPNGYFLMTNPTQNNILLYDNNMKFREMVNEIDDEEIEIKYVTVGPNNTLFMSDQINHQVIKTDLEFNQLAVFGDGAGDALNQFNYPKGICCYDNYVFVCDYGNKRVQKLDTNLVFKQSFLLNHIPWYLKNINNVALMRSSLDTSMYFYDLNNFNLLKKYDDHAGIIGVSTSRFYEYYSQNKTFYVYDHNGELIKSIETDCFGSPEESAGSICIFNSKLYLQHFHSEFMAVF